MIGTTLGHYRIVEALGAGGMGEVYRARDERLRRQVAIKVVPDEFGANADRLSRFECEARTLASLNHPHIAQIYGLEEHQGRRFLVLELVEGESLAQRLGRGAVPVEETLKLALQIARGLQAAHERGIVHRDLKPANIMLTPEGGAKVLDFGIAKTLAEAAPSETSRTLTVAGPATRGGILVGTPAYMSPEQARGRPVDRRVDIWAFGVVLWHMLTGQHPFEADSDSDTLAAVLQRELDFAALPPDTPGPLRRLLRRCLERDPDRRLHDIADARLEIEQATDEPVPSPEDSSALVVPPPLWRRVEASWRAPQRWSASRWAAVIGVSIIGATVAAGALWRLSRTEAPRAHPTQRFTVNLPGLAPLDSSGLLALSRDGRTLIYKHSGEGRGQLYRRAMNELGVSPIRDTEGAANPFLSPDGSWVGFFSKGKLQKASLSGGSPFTICDAPGWSTATWGPDGTIVFHDRRGGLSRVSANGGVPEPITAVGASGELHWSPHFVPSGEAVLFTIWTWSRTRHIAVYSLDTGEQRVLFEGLGPHYSSGHLVFCKDDPVFGPRGVSLWAVPFDEDSLETKGDPFLVVEAVQVAQSRTPQFDVSDDGKLVYVTPEPQSQRELVWVDRQGLEEPTGLPPGDYGSLRVSPDGKRVAFTGEGDIWIADLARGTRTRVTSHPSPETFPNWTPDGRRVIFDSHREEPDLGFFWQAADGTGSAERLVHSEDPGSSCWTPDGRTIVFEYWSRGQHWDIGVLSMDGERTWQPLIHTEANETSPDLSPDGRWLAYASDETGQHEVYVQSFPDLGERRLISTGGGSQPRWSPGGGELYYRRWDDDAMMVAAVAAASELTVGKPVVLFTGPHYRFTGFPYLRSYDIAPDGRRFLMTKVGAAPGEEAQALGQVVVVLNWLEDVNR